MLIPEHEVISKPLDVNWTKQLNDNTESYRAPKRVCNMCAQELSSIQEHLRQSLSRANQELIVDGHNQHFFVGVPQLNYLLESEISNATLMLQNFAASTLDDEVPRELLKVSKGVAFFTILKAGFMFTGRYGNYET